VHLAHPLGVKGFSYRRVKNDEKDAAGAGSLVGEDAMNGAAHRACVLDQFFLRAGPRQGMVPADYS
jgi:hypothetical protein